MHRRRDLLGSLLAAAAVVPSQARAAGRVIVVYVSAWDCPPCIDWSNTHWKTFQESPEFKKVEWVKINSPAIREAYKNDYWPQELRAFRDKAKLKRGVPRWMVIKNDKIVFSGFGKTTDFPDWSSEVLPAIKKAVADL